YCFQVSTLIRSAAAVFRLYQPAPSRNRPWARRISPCGVWASDVSSSAAATRVAAIASEATSVLFMAVGAPYDATAGSGTGAGPRRRAPGSLAFLRIRVIGGSLGRGRGVEAGLLPLEQVIQGLVGRPGLGRVVRLVEQQAVFPHEGEQLTDGRRPMPLDVAD